MALRRNKSGTCCWRNNYWILLGSSDVSKSGLLSHPSHTAPQRKSTFLQIQSTARKVIFLISRKRLNILPKVVVLCLIYKYNELFIEVNQIHSWKNLSSGGATDESELYYFLLLFENCDKDSEFLCSLFPAVPPSQVEVSEFLGGGVKVGVWKQ